MKLITNKRDSNGLINKEFNEFLKTPVPKTDVTQEQLDGIKTALEKALETYPGLGISANQLGIKKRVCLINIEPYDYKIFLVNPVIVERSDEMFLFYEGCLSLPKTIEQFIPTIRHQRIVVETENMGRLIFEVNKEKDEEKTENGERKVSLETLQTVVVQHEIDHLDGLTIKDRQYTTTYVKQQTYGRNDKIIMKSPSGELIEIKYKKANDYFLKGYEVV